jgi:hypothetical protein
MKGLALIMKAAKSKKPVGDDAPSFGEESEEEAPESEPGDSSADAYKAEIADAAKAGDWDAFADAVAGLVRCSGGE